MTTNSLSIQYYNDELKRIQQEYEIGVSNLNILQENIIEAFQVAYSDDKFFKREVPELYDYGLFELARGNVAEAIGIAEELIEKANKVSWYSNFLKSEHYLKMGVTYSEGMQYAQAIESLNKSIEKNPENKEAYFERAVAYFETGNFDIAMQDFLTSEAHEDALINLPVSEDFTKALLFGLAKGAQEASVEYFPRLANSAYGLTESLWIFAQQPLDSTTNFANACYEAANCTVDYLKELDLEKIEGYQEDLINLYRNYDSLPENQKGQMIGYLVGKFGVDIFLPGTALKALSSWNKLRAANKLCNFKSMGLTAGNKAIIAEKATSHAIEREKFFKNAKIHWDKQNKHIPGTRNYMENRSIFEHRDPQGLVNKFAGKGIPVRGRDIKKLDYRENVNFGEFIGYHVDELTFLKTPTTYGDIRYSKTGVHIVPTLPPGSKVWK